MLDVNRLRVIDAVADGDPHPISGGKQIVERCRPGRDVDASHVAWPPVGREPATLDRDGVAHADIAPDACDPQEARLILDPHFVDYDVDSGLVNRCPHRLGTG